MGELRSMRAIRAIAVSCALVSGVALAAEPKGGAPSAAAKDEARARLQKGLKLYDQGAFEAALSELQRAYELAPTYKLLYNIGLVYRALNDDAGALKAFTQYVDQGGKDVPTKRRADVERQISELKSLVATLTITSNVEDAEVTIDDVPAGKTPLAAPVVVNAGRRKITATKAGLAPVTEVVNVAGQDTKTIALSFDLAPEQPPGSASAPPVPPPPREGTSSTRSIPWVGWAATGVLATGAIVTGALALSASRELKTDREGPTTRAELDAAQKKTKTWALVTDVLTGATLVAGGVSLYFTLKKDEGQAPSTEVGVGPGTITLRRRFLRPRCETARLSTGRLRRVRSPLVRECRRRPVQARGRPSSPTSRS